MQKLLSPMKRNNPAMIQAKNYNYKQVSDDSKARNNQQKNTLNKEFKDSLPQNHEVRTGSSY